MRKTLILIAIALGLTIIILCSQGCGKPQPAPAASTAPPGHPPCPDGYVFSSWVPRADPRPFVMHSPTQYVVVIFFPHGILTCSRN